MSLEMSLDDIIKQNRISIRGTGRQRGRGGSTLRGVRQGRIVRRNSGRVELFQEFGPMRRAAVHYDRSGRSLGTAEVVYLNRLSAIKAQNRYNGVPLDGRPMNIQLVGGAATATPDGVNTAASVNRISYNTAGRRPANRRGVSGPFSGRGAGRGRRGREEKVVPTKEELDAELAAYNAQRS